MPTRSYLKALRFAKWLKKNGVPHRWLGTKGADSIYISVTLPHPSLEIDHYGRARLLRVQLRFSDHAWGVGTKQREHKRPHLSIDPTSGYDIGHARRMVREVYQVVENWPPNLAER